MQYLHANLGSNFRQTLGYEDSILPPGVSNFSLINSRYPIMFEWDEVTDSSKIARYAVYKNDRLGDFTLQITHQDLNIKTGDSISYRITAIDRAGNESGPSQVLSVGIPDTLNKIINGEFDQGFSGWIQDVYHENAAANFSVDATSAISGQNSAYIEVIASTGTDWHIQLQHPLIIQDGKRYIINYQAKASQPKTIVVALQQDDDPYYPYMWKDVHLTSAIQSFSDTVTVDTSDTVKLEFIVGHIGLADFWVDAVSVFESDTVATDIEDGTERVSVTNAFCLMNAYPNPFNAKTTITYALPKRGFVHLSIYNILGQPVATLVKSVQNEGTHQVAWDAKNVGSSIYFYRIELENFSSIKKCILLK